jgi:hypothetical protein
MSSREALVAEAAITGLGWEVLTYAGCVLLLAALCVLTGLFFYWWTGKVLGR